MIKDSMPFGDFLYTIYPQNNTNNNLMIKSITFQVTEDCNLNCSYCYQFKKTQNKMKFDTAKKFIDYIFQSYNTPGTFYYKENTQGFIIDFIGGEPFLEIDLIEQIIEYFELNLLKLPEENLWLLNHIYNFSTNGTLYFTNKVQTFIKKYRSLIKIGVTVDGNQILHDSCRLFPNGTGSYDLAIQAALKEKKDTNYGGTKITLSPENIQYLNDGIKNMIQLGFQEINVNCCYEDVWKNFDYKMFENELIKLSDWICENNLYDKIYISLLDPENFRPLDESTLDQCQCGVGKGNMTAINCSGNIYPCIRFMETSLTKEPIIIGTADNGLLSNQKQLDNYNIISNTTKRKILSPECLKCDIAKNCSYCLACNYEITGNFNTKINTICGCYKVTAKVSKYLCDIVNDKYNKNLIKLDNIVFDFL